MAHWNHSRSSIAIRGVFLGAVGLADPASCIFNLSTRASSDHMAKDIHSFSLWEFPWADDDGGELLSGQVIGVRSCEHTTDRAFRNAMFRLLSLALHVEAHEQFVVIIIYYILHAILLCPRSTPSLYCFKA